MTIDKLYYNYHKHTHYSNLRTLDVITKPIDYINRAKELNQDIYFTTEHGWGGNVWEAYTLCKENNMKCIYGVEAYYVDNRFEKDKGNYHIILIALNNDAFKEINKIMSLANTEGYYYKPRIDLELLLSLNPKNIIITTACIGGRLFKTEHYIEEFVIPIKNHFKNNFYLEVQCHNDEYQKKWNKKILDLSYKYNIEIIHANDSHYIKKEDSKYRDMFLRAKGIFYEEESNFTLDYPTYDEIVFRYEQQNILNKDEINKAINNTLIFKECEGLVLTDEIKLPKIHKDKNSNELLKSIILKEFKRDLKEIDKKNIKEYKKALDYEMNIIEKTKMEDYFILDYEIVKKAVEEYGGVLTKTGRGSAPSFYINKVLGLTNIDRLDSPITLYPTRFMSISRILESRSLPDIDMNWANVEPVIKASKDILGEDGIYYMIAYKPLQDSSAFRLWCKAIGKNIDEYNEIAKELDSYINDKYWGEIIEDSKIFRGVIESVAPSPCSFLLMDKPISEEVGLIKVGDVVCCCLDGYNCDKYKFLKNDYLTVSVWDIIDKTFKLIGKPIPTIKELNNLLTEDVWKLYEKGLTATLNQADSDFATPLIRKYSPKSVAEISAWVAGIRPGFASLLNIFLNRKYYTTGVKELDNILKDSFHFMMYQESIMKYLVWLGIEESETYDIIKKISKKKFKEDELSKLKEKLIKGWIKNVGTENGFEETWQVVEDASKYSFNASHSLSVGYDSLYGAYLKANYPLEYYTVILNAYNDDTEKTAKITSELDFFNIKILPPKFRFSKSTYMMNKENNSIYKGLQSIKYLNEQVSENLYLLRDNKYNNFIELLYDINKTGINSRQLDILIKLDFFSEFGKSKKLLKTVDIFNKFSNIKQLKKEKILEYNIDINIIKKYFNKETDKMFKDINNVDGLINELINNIENKDISIKEKIKSEIEFIGYPITIYSNAPNNFYIISEYKTYKDNTKPYVVLYNVKTGEMLKTKIKDGKIFSSNPFKLYDLLKVIKFKIQKKTKNIDGKWMKTEEDEQILFEYEVY